MRIRTHILLLCLVVALCFAEEFETKPNYATGTLVVSTIDGYLTAIDVTNGLEKWKSKEGPLLTSPLNIQQDFTFIPNPQDGQLYILGDGRLSKLPFTIPQLVKASPCRSNDGLLYAGSKKDVWISINPETGTRVEALPQPTADSFCPVSQPETVFIGRTVYRISMLDTKRPERQWNATFTDYSSHLLPPEANYPFQHITSLTDGRILTIDAASGITLWRKDFNSVIVNMYLLKEDGMHRLRSTSLGKETFDAMLENSVGIPNQYWENEPFGTKNLENPSRPKDLYPTLYVGETASGLFAMPTLVDDKTITIAPKYIGPPLLEGPTPIAVNTKDAPRNMPTERPILRTNDKLQGSTYRTVGGEYLLLGYHEEPAPIAKHLMTTQMPDILPERILLEYLPDYAEKGLNPWSKQGRCMGDRCYPHYNGPPQITEEKPEWTLEVILGILWQNYPKFVLSVGISMLLLIVTVVWYHGKQMGHAESRDLARSAEASHASRSSKGSTRRTWSLFGSSDTSETVVEVVDGLVHVGKIQYDPKAVLGRGCEGTVVYKGKFDGREAAVKRVMSDLIKLIDREVDLLRESDSHPNVIRYFCSESDHHFRYIALELCECSLKDYVREQEIRHRYSLTELDILQQAADGVSHLHAINIVHRDIKPQNILISSVDNRGRARVLISDFGLSKQLKMGHHSVSMMSGLAGTEGWMAPEVLLSQTSVTCAVDVFSLGCIFYYVLSEGKHPFGDTIRRQDNILRGQFDLQELSAKSDFVGLHLVEWMLQNDPKKRPASATVVSHPLFWSKERQLQFFNDVSDRVEKEDERSEAVQSLEHNGWLVVSRNWHNSISRTLQEDLRKNRTYRGHSICDLLRAIRNKKHHYRELPLQLRQELGEIPNEYVTYFTSLFPKLLIHVYKSMAICAHESVFGGYYPPAIRSLSDMFTEEVTDGFVPVKGALQRSNVAPPPGFDGMPQHVQSQPNLPLSVADTVSDWRQRNGSMPVLKKTNKHKKKKKAPFSTLLSTVAGEEEENAADDDVEEKMPDGY
jgi:serine/threonine-protein kinase/endoribonuclease IRE1